MRISPYAALPALVGALLLGGCGSQGTDGSSSTGSSTSGSASATPTPTLSTTLETPPPPGDPTDPPLPRGSQPVTATGRVTISDIEQACVGMTISGQTYQLVGAGVTGLRNGQVVTVTGYADGSRATTCQVGPVLVVTKLTKPGAS